MREIKCKELYRVPITIDMIGEFIELGRLYEKKDKIVIWLRDNEDISPGLRFSWMKEYYKEWNENMEDISTRIRKKTNLENVPNLITYELGSKEIVVLDILKEEYQKICRKNYYLVSIKF